MSAFGKEFLRTIARKPGRFLALLAIVALGAGFYAGLRMTCPDMKIALDEYFDNTNTYDIRVASTYGLTDDDIAALRSIDSLESVQPAFECDAVAAFNGADYTFRFHSLSPSANSSVFDGVSSVQSDDPEYLNRLLLLEGRWPQANNECVICEGRIMDTPYGVGDRIEVNMSSGMADATLEEKTYTVVGLVHAPYYVAQVNMGSSSLGAGVVQQYAYVPETDFKRTVPYSEAFITVKGARGEFNGSDAYKNVIDAVMRDIEAIAPERERIREENLTSLSSLRFADEITTYQGMLDVAKFALQNPSSSIEDMGECEWLVMDRTKNVGAVSFTSDGERVDHIASVFPFVFFLVAALVALTTMTRMVDEERLLIGTYKALGYTRARITGKYLAYGLLAAGVGSVIGIAALSQLLPFIIMYAYSIVYQVPVSQLPIEWGIAGASAGLSVGITLVTTWFSVTATLREKPAYLLLPPVPSIGKRILLERISALWSRLSFSWKVTCRNIFRYKRRFFMTLIGIAGCTGLLLTGFGLHDSINDIIDVQYNDIVHYNAAVTTVKNVEAEDRQKLDTVLTDPDLVTSATDVHQQTMLASGPNKSDKRADIIVPHDEAAFTAMVTLRDRITHERVAIPEEGAVVNEKLARELGVGVGDEFTLAEQDAMGNATPDAYTFTVAGISENYVSNYVYVNPRAFEQATGKEPAYATHYANVVSDSQQRAAFETRLGDIKAVKTIMYNDETISSYRTMLRSVDLVVVVLIVSAAALAFIVLYNLTNINIEERIREIATLKVLGFTRRETHAYIFREVILLSLIGCLVGMAFGVVLENFVVTSAEVDQVMFGRTIHVPSFLLSFALTMAFSALSLLLMLPKIGKIDMVESLKSNE